MSPNLIIFASPEYFRDAFCVAGGAFGRRPLQLTTSVYLISLVEWTRVHTRNGKCSDRQTDGTDGWTDGRAK